MKACRKSQFITLFFILLGLCIGLISPAFGEITLPEIFSDHMVIQSNSIVPIWGWAQPKEQVSVTIANQTKTIIADNNGRWMIKLDKLNSGNKLILTIKGKNTIIIRDVLAGEVWLCAGQSNMRMILSGVDNAKEEIASADFPKIRMFIESSPAATTLQEKCKGRWEICSPKTAGNFTATAYFFGREIHKTLGAPVGLINSSVGGTPIESWISLNEQKKHPEFKPIFKRYDLSRIKYEATFWTARIFSAKIKTIKFALSDFYPGNSFNAKIAPLIPYAIKGVIWYQGEANANTIERGKLYALQLKTMIQQWRALWEQNNLPFYWVQLPKLHKSAIYLTTKNGWVYIRESMLKDLNIPNTGMIVTIDLDDNFDLHPKTKQEVGRRLALWALAKTYGQNIIFSGPLPIKHEISSNKMIISFKYADDGLIAKNEKLKGFAISGGYNWWFNADAKIEGNKVIVSSPYVKHPVAIRYGWAINPDCNLYNSIGLPASPFRTDNW